MYRCTRPVVTHKGFNCPACECHYSWRLCKELRLIGRHVIRPVATFYILSDCTFWQFRYFRMRLLSAPAGTSTLTNPLITIIDKLLGEWKGRKLAKWPRVTQSGYRVGNSNRVPRNYVSFIEDVTLVRRGTFWPNTQIYVYILDDILVLSIVCWLSHLPDFKNTPSIYCTYSIGILSVGR